MADAHDDAREAAEDAQKAQEDRAEALTRQAEAEARAAEEAKEAADKAEEEAKLLKSPVTDWLIYNAFNYQLNHNEKIGFFEEYKEVVDQKILEFMLENK